MPEPSKPSPRIRFDSLPPVAPGLHIVSTPIGNLADITLRALQVLGAADVVYCEDTRQTRKLLERYGIEAATRAYNDHNAAEARPEIIARLGEGQTVALVSDAGTPLISDPGFKLVRGAIEAGHSVTAAPGATAAIMALTLSGLPSDVFTFAGFLSARQMARRAALEKLKDAPGSLLLYEAPGRLGELLSDAADVLGDRPAAVARELTKIYEEVRRGTLRGLAAAYGDGPAPKGEIVLVIGPPEPLQAPASQDESLGEALKAALAKMTLKEAVAAVSLSLKRPRKEVYARALALTRAADK